MRETPHCLVGSSAADVAEYIIAGEEALSRYLRHLDEYRRREAELITAFVLRSCPIEG